MPSSSANVQHDETERLKNLLQYEILDTLPDPAFDEIARMAASICNAPYAFIGFLLVAGLVQVYGWFRGAPDTPQRVGVPVSFA
jgi:hypothetical protein